MLASIFNPLLKTGFRSLRGHKWSTVLNLMGLSIGLAGGALIVMDIQYELSYDTLFEKADRIYRVYAKYPGQTFRGSDFSSYIPAPAARAMVAELPEIESAVRFLGWPHATSVRAEGAESEETFSWCDPSFFSMFDVPLVTGDPLKALRAPRTAVISRSAAQRLFDERDPIGKTIQVSSDTVWVTGVMEDMPQNSHFTASVFVSLSTAIEIHRSEEKWDFPFYNTTILLKKGSNPESLREKLPAFVKTHLGQRLGAEVPQYFIQPIRDIHLGSTGINSSPPDVADFRTILTLSALALVLLASASINYANLTTAHASLRAREVGIRKVTGARRGDLIGQFLGESLLTTMLAGFLALLIAELFLPTFSNLSGKQFPWSALLNIEFLLWFISLTIAVGLIAGCFPAVVLSAFSPAAILKGAAVARGKSRLRDALVVLQFAAAIGLAICALTIFNQLSFMRTSDPGYNRKQVLSIRMIRPESVQRQPVFMEQAATLSGVVGVTASSGLPIEIFERTGLAVRNDKGQVVYAPSYSLSADDSFLGVYQIPLLRGRQVSGKPVALGGAAIECVVNETFAHVFGLSNPIGKQFSWRGKTAVIVGLIRDFHLQSFRQPIAPLIITQNMIVEGINGTSALYVSIRVHPEGLNGTIEAMREVWNKTMRDNTFGYWFVDDSFNRMYASDEKFGQTVVLFTALGLFIGAMGLLGMATFMVQTRRKEIAIRKVFGATSTSVAGLLSKEFLFLVVLSNILAGPFAFYVMHRWLSNFVYRIPLGPGPFLLAGGLAAVLALMTVSLQALRAASANPVESIRYE